MLLLDPKSAFAHRYSMVSTAVRKACPWVRDESGTGHALTSCAETMAGVRQLLGAQSDAIAKAIRLGGDAAALPLWEPEWSQLFQAIIMLPAFHPNLMTAGVAARVASIILLRMPEELLSGPDAKDAYGDARASSGAGAEPRREASASLSEEHDDQDMSTRAMYGEAVSLSIRRLWSAMMTRIDSVAGVAPLGPSTSAEVMRLCPGALDSATSRDLNKIAMAVLRANSRYAIARESACWSGVIELSVAALLRGFNPACAPTPSKLIDVMTHRYLGWEGEAPHIPMGSVHATAAVEMQIRPLPSCPAWHSGPIGGSLLGDFEAVGRGIQLLLKVRTSKRKAALARMRHAAMLQRMRE